MADKDVKEASVRTPARRAAPAFTESLIEPLSRLRGEVDRLFADFPARWPRFELGGLGAAIAAPVIEMTESDKAYKLSVEVPGVEPAEIDVTVDGDMLVIAGEKKDEREESDKGYHYSERSYGAFERRIALPIDVDPDSIKAHVRKGVLQIKLPKSDNAPSQKRRIAIDAA